MFGSSQIKLSDKVLLHFLNIETYNANLLEEINSEIAKVWNGDNDADDDISIIKTELRDLFKKKTSLQKHGIVSEFICHLYLRKQGYEQHFLFRNLEEKGMKKGFDGLYLLGENYWIYESKSTLSETINPTHNANISEAYNDLKKKIEGKNITNNPWKNAYTHAGNIAINVNDTLVQTLKSFSREYVNKKYHKISEFNVIPSSTIYLDSKWCIIDESELKEKLNTLVNRYDCKRLNVICINKKTINDFVNFING